MTGTLRTTCSRVALALGILAPSLPGAALAQTTDERGGLTVREVSVSTGYSWVQLPPITLGGFLPQDVLKADLITDAAGAIEWRRNSPRTRMAFDLFGTYTARARYARLNAPGADLRFGVSHAASPKWLLGAGAAGAVVGSDQLAVQTTEGRWRPETGVPSGSLPRSPHPDRAQAALFGPVRQSLVGADLHGSRILASSAHAEAAYAHSARLATSVRGNYATARRISSNRHPEEVLAFPDASAGGAGAGVRYDRSERVQLTAALDWSHTTGVTADDFLLATAGFTWSGRQWFTVTTAGVAARPFRRGSTGLSGAGAPSRTPALIWNAALGYSDGTQSLLVRYSREAHDAYGYGGRNAGTGFDGDVQSVGGSWSWSSPRGRWLGRADLSMIRRPGNFSYIYAWLGTAGVGRRLGPHVRLMGEVVFDRHGSRGFEGFHLTREGARLTLVWTPSRRPVE